MRNARASMMPGATIDYGRNGTLIRLIAGGAPEDDGGGAGDGQGATVWEIIRIGNARYTISSGRAAALYRHILAKATCRAGRCRCA
jgi:hypothetical protein